MLLDAVRNIQGASRWAAKAHSQEWLCPRSGVGGWGPGMGLAGFEEGEDGHEEREPGEEAVADYGGDGQRLGCGEAAAINLHACGVGVDHGTEETEDQQRAQGG